ncbi:hypothetical protein FEM48_Zijuj11G0067400 [Ziziphus jujuba var. spinosa]|uniref:Polycomb protein VEFS-Box domain-containing protein n=1 Tax=Ziziphus jujuba var. spinosa TaxID=714518 RepID=A0A978UHF6_ZIZJJ|nr:hypothetical protein FEM48_Zijuj11G0067400 [Ziziphus jujuba var. spinosa]
MQSGRHGQENNDRDCPSSMECIERVGSSSNVPGITIAMAQSSMDLDCAKPLSGSDPAPPAKTKKTIERSDPRNRVLLQKRQFYHSHRVQPMALEQVMSDRDSEDEVDDDIADLEDRRMLDDFVDVTKDEKKLMHLWNAFVRQQRVLADGHIPWACEAFSKLHGEELVSSQALFCISWVTNASPHAMKCVNLLLRPQYEERCWRLFMIKLWNHGLLDACTMNNCNIILEEHRNKVPDAKTS